MPPVPQPIAGEPSLVRLWAQTVTGQELDRAGDVANSCDGVGISALYYTVTVPAGMRLIDLSVPLEHLSTSEPLPARIHYVRHDGEGLAQMQQFFGVGPADLVYSGGQGWAIEEIHAITHTGTHVDAPRHPGRNRLGSCGCRAA